MAKVKLALTASPSFRSKVGIPVPGSKPVEVEFTFKGRTCEQFKEFVESLAGMEDVDAVMGIASGWELDDPFTRENVALLVDNYLGAARVIIEQYFAELTQARLGN